MTGSGEFGVDVRNEGEGRAEISLAHGRLEIGHSKSVRV